MNNKTNIRWRIISTTRCWVVVKEKFVYVQTYTGFPVVMVKGAWVLMKPKHWLNHIFIQRISVFTKWPEGAPLPAPKNSPKNVLEW